MTLPPFHLAFPIADIEETRAFFVELLGAKVGRESDRWIDFDFFGHQISAHVALEELSDAQRNPVDGHQVPVRHFGVILPWEEWHALAARLKAAEVTFLIEPYIRFAGQPGEQATLFISDPSGNGLEFKSFRDPSRVFATT
ncbi:MAG: glyoxalase [Myxococcales bacterium]|nr:glyoxalase [Myxococcales bacterium]